MHTNVRAQVEQKKLIYLELFSDKTTILIPLVQQVRLMPSAAVVKAEKINSNRKRGLFFFFSFLSFFSTHTLTHQKREDGNREKKGAQGAGQGRRHDSLMLARLLSLFLSLIYCFLHSSPVALQSELIALPPLPPLTWPFEKKICCCCRYRCLFFFSSFLFFNMLSLI